MIYSEGSEDRNDDFDINQNRARAWYDRMIDHIGEVASVKMGFRQGSKVYISADEWESGYIDYTTLFGIFREWELTDYSLTSLRFNMFSNTCELSEDPVTRYQREVHDTLEEMLRVLRS